MKVFLIFIVFLVLHTTFVRSEEKVDDGKKAPWEVPLEEFESIVRTGDALVVDVREPDEVSEVRVDAKRYLNIPLQQVEKSLTMSPSDFEDAYKHPKPDPNEEIVFICRSGRRSDYALQSARKLNYLRTSHFAGGTRGWTEHFPDRTVSEKNIQIGEKIEL